MTSTSPKSQGPEASGALSKKNKRPKSKKPPTKTKVIPPNPMKGSEQSHSISSGTLPDPQDLERDIQVASTGLPSTLDDGIRKSKPLIEGGNKPPADMAPQNPTDADLLGTGAKMRLRKVRKTFWELVKEMDNNPQSTKTQHLSFPLQQDKPTSSTSPHTEASDTDSSSDKILKKYDDTLLLTKQKLVKYLKKVSSSIDDYYKENMAHKDQTDKLMKASMRSLEKSSATINDLYKGLEVITQLLKDITKSVKDDPAINKKIKEASKTLAKISTQTKPKQSTDRNIEFIGSSTHPHSITQAQPITIIHPEPFVPQKEGKEYWVKEEEIKKAEEEARLNAISKTEVIKVIHEEAKKLGIHLKKAITTKAGELFKKAHDAKHEVLKRQHTEKVRKSLELIKHKAFGISKLNKVREIIPKKKNIVKHVELEPETRISGLECNRDLPENVPFVNNMVIKEPKYGIFFTDKFGNQAFQRWSDIDKVGLEALMSYLVAVSMVKSPKNARFSMKLRKLITEHPDQEKLKSKKVKLEAPG
nr:hypothetical protein [Tanacetum cinerariifolium]